MGVGAVLSQKYDDSEHLVAYVSVSLSKTEKNYCTTEREALALV